MITMSKVQTDVLSVSSGLNLTKWDYGTLLAKKKQFITLFGISNFIYSTSILPWYDFYSIFNVSRKASEQRGLSLLRVLFRIKPWETVGQKMVEILRCSGINCIGMATLANDREKIVVWHTFECNDSTIWFWILILRKNDHEKCKNCQQLYRIFRTIDVKSKEIEINFGTLLNSVEKGEKLNRI